MFSFLKTKKHIGDHKPENLFFCLPIKRFAHGKWNLYRFRKEMDNYRLKDFTKVPSAKKWIDEQIETQKKKLKTEKFTNLMKESDKRILKNLNPYFSPHKRQFNKFVRRSAIKKSHLNEEKDFEELEMRLFSQDHTAQVLENIRKQKENKIFNRKLHEISEKKLALKLESRKPENILENYENNFLNYQNYNDSTFDSKRIYGLTSFTPLGKRQFGINLETPNELVPLRQIESGNLINKHIEFQKNKNELANKRIESLLNNRRTNESLQKYLIDQQIQQSSAEKIAEVQNKTLSQLSTHQNVPSLSLTLTKNKLDVAKENKMLSDSLKNFFKPQVELTTKIEQYELEIYNEFKNQDLYNKYKKGIVIFGELSLEENLNYIKFNIRNSNELFNLYEEIMHKDFTKYKKENKEIQPIILSAILQKIAVGAKNLEQIPDLLSNTTYKELLVNIKKNIKNLTDRNLVDNLWSLGKLHRGTRNFCHAIFQKLLYELIQEISDKRIDYLNFEQISFLLEGLDYLRIHPGVDSQEVCQIHSQLSERVYERVCQIVSIDPSSVHLHPYNMAKILNYFYWINFEVSKYHKLLDKVGNHLKEFLKTYQAILADSLERKDIIKLVRAFSWGIVKHGLAGEDEQLQLRPKSIGEEEGKLTLFSDKKQEKMMNFLSIFKESEFKSESGVQFYKEVLESLVNPIVSQCKQFEITHCTSLIYHYANANHFHKFMIKELNVQISKKLDSCEDFRLDDLLHYTFGISKFYTKDIFPFFNLDVMNIIYPNLFEKSTSHKFLLLSKFKAMIFDKKDTLNIQNLSLVLYSCSIIGYADMDFYLPIYHNIIVTDKEYYSNRDNNRLPPIKLHDLGYLMQSLSFLNFNEEYICKYFIQKFLNILNFNLHQGNEGHQIKYPLNHFSVSQILSSSVNLSLRKMFRESYYWQSTLEKLKNYIGANFTTNDINSSVSALWFLSYFEMFDKIMFDKLLTIIFDKKENLRKFESVVLNQVIVYNYVKCNYLFEGMSKEFVENLNTMSRNFDIEKKNVQKKIQIENLYKEDYFGDKIVQLLKTSEKSLNNEKLNFVENYTVANSYIVPLYFPEKNLCLFFYDHTERLKNFNVNGYNSLKEDILYSLNFKIERIFADECEPLDTDEKILNFVYTKIR
jgi:hypothetical protein